MATIIDELQVNINAKYNTKSLGNMTKKLEDLGVAIQKLTAMTGGLQGVGNAIGGINQQISKLPKTNIKISQSANSVSSSYSNVRKIVDGVFKAMGDGAKSTINLMKKLSSAVVSLGRGAFNTTANSMKGLFTFILKSSNPLAFNIGRLSSSFKTLLGTMIGFYGIRSLFSWMKDAVVSGADVAETNHIVQETFKDLAGTVEQWSQTTMEQFGMTSIAAKRYAGVLSSMFQASNIEYKKAATMATELTGLAGDLASFYNIDIATAYKKIQSGMAGQSRPLLALGIDMRVAALEAYRMEQGITKSYQSMNTAEKTMLRYQYLMSVTSKQQGDFARTAGSMANQLRTFRAYASAITATIGDGLASALRHVVKYLNVFMSAVYKAVQLFATFMKTIFGANVSGGGFTLEEDFGDADDYADDFADSVSDASDGLGSAADNAKELRKELSVLPFDELNQLNKPNEASGGSGGSGGSGAGGGGKSIGDVGTALFDIDDLVNQGTIPEAISAWAQQIRAAFDNQQWNTLGNVIAMGINQAVEKVYAILDPQKVKDKVFPYIDAFTTTFNSLVYHLDFDMIGRTVGRGIEDILLIFNRLVTGINWKQLGKSWAEYFNGIFKEVSPEDVGRTIANVFNAVNRYLWGAVFNINWTNLGSFISRSINSLISYADFLTLADIVSQGINGLVEAFNGIVDPNKGVNFATLAIKIGTALVKMISDIKWERIGTLLGNLWSSAWDLLKNFVVTLGNDGSGTGLGAGINKALKKAIELAKNSRGDIAKTISKFAQAVCSDIVDAMGEPSMWYDLGYTIGGALGDILSNAENWKKAKDAINAITDGLVALLKGAIAGLTEHGDEIMKGFGEFLGGLDWGNILTLAAPAIALKIGSWVIAGAVKEKAKGKIVELLSHGLLESGASGVLKAAAGSALTAIIGGATVTVAGVKIGEAFKSVFEIMQGGNGFDTEGGAAIQKLIDRMRELNDISEDTGKKLFNLKESWENGEINDATFFSQFGRILEDGGMNAVQAQIFISRLKDEFGLTDEQVKILNKSIAGMDEVTLNAEHTVSTFGQNVEMSANRISHAFAVAVIEMQKTGDTKTTQALVNARLRFDELTNSGTDIQTAFQKVCEEFGITGDAADKLGDALSEEYGVGGMFSALMGTAQGATTNVNKLNKAMSLTGHDNSGITSATEAMEKNAEQTGKSAENQKAYNEAAEATPSSSTTAANTIVSVITTLLSALGIKAAVKTAAEDAPNGVTESFEAGEDGMKTGIRTTLSKVLAACGVDAKTNAQITGGLMALGVKKGIDDNTGQVEKSIGSLNDHVYGYLLQSMEAKSPSRLYAKAAEYIPQGMAKGIGDKESDVLTSMKKLLDNLARDSKTAMDQFTRDMGTYGGSAVKSMVDGATNQANQFNSYNFFSNIFSGAMKYMQGLNDTMYRLGHNAMQSFANGLSSVRVRVPHIYVSGWNTTYYGNGGWFQTPNFGVSWYGRGGLFTSPSLVAGLGEAGNEAVLPLENKRTMGMIADAITNNGSSSLGINAEDLQEAVATGVAMAMSQNPQTVQINVHSELRTNDETLAESVSRGQARLDRRYNATPAYSY